MFFSFWRQKLGPEPLLLVSSQGTLFGKLDMQSQLSKKAARAFVAGKHLFLCDFLYTNTTPTFPIYVVRELRWYIHEHIKLSQV